MTSPTPSLGQRIRELRGHLYTQRELAERAEISVDVIRKLEQGVRSTASPATLHRIAQALDVTLADLLTPASMPENDKDHGITRLLHTVSGVDDLLGEYNNQAYSAQEAKHAEIQAWQNYWTGQHDAAVVALPAMISGLEASIAGSHTKSAEHEIRYSLSRVLWAAGCTLTLLRHPQAAYLAVRRAITLAQQLDDPYMSASAHGSLSWQLLVAGRYAESEALSLKVAERIQPSGKAQTPQMSVYGSLILQAGNAAARAGRADAAKNYLAEAKEVSQYVPDGRCDHSTNFGPSLIAMQHTDIAINLGEYGDASNATRSMPEEGRNLPKQTQCRHAIDKALVSLRLGHSDDAINIINVVSETAPVWIKNQRLPKSIVKDVLYSERRHSEKVKSLASRLGVR